MRRAASRRQSLKFTFCGPHPRIRLAFNVRRREDGRFWADPSASRYNCCSSAERRGLAVVARWGEQPPMAIRPGGCLAMLPTQLRASLCRWALRCRAAAGADFREKRPAALAWPSVVAGGKVSDGQAFVGIRRLPDGLPLGNVSITAALQRW